jgi:hypothetical protein
MKNKDVRLTPSIKLTPFGPKRKFNVCGGNKFYPTFKTIPRPINDGPKPINVSLYYEKNLIIN